MIYLLVIIVASPKSIYVEDNLSRPSSTFFLGSSIVGVAAIVIFIFLSRLYVVSFSPTITIQFVSQLVYLGVQLGNRTF